MYMSYINNYIKMFVYSIQYSPNISFIIAGISKKTNK